MDFIRYAGFEKQNKTPKNKRKHLVFICVYSKCFFLFLMFSFVFLKARSVS